MYKVKELSVFLLVSIISYASAAAVPETSTPITINSPTTSATNSQQTQDFSQFFADLMNKFSITNSSKSSSDIPDFIRSSKFSPSINLQNFAEKITAIQQNFPNATVFIDCDLKFKKALKNSKIFSFKNCDPGKVLSNKNFTRIFESFPSAFLVSFEIQGDVENSNNGQNEDLKDLERQDGLRRSKINKSSSLETQEQVRPFSSVEVHQIEENFDNIHRSFLILVHNSNSKSKSQKVLQNTSQSVQAATQHPNQTAESPVTPSTSPPYSTYLIENSHLTHLAISDDDSKFSLGNFIASLDSQHTNTSIIYYSDKIIESLTNNCHICLRTLQLLNLKNYLLNLEIPNGNQLRKFHCDIDCFRALLITPTDFNFTKIPEYISILLHEKFINSLRIKTADVISMNENVTVDEFMESHSVTMELEGLTTFAFLQKQFRVLEFLVRADCPYPVNFTSDKENGRMYPSKNRFVQKLEAHMNRIKKFHKDIKNGKIDEVKKFLVDNKDIKFARDEENKSALKVAFETDQLEVYAMLKSHGMMMSSLEEIVEKHKKINDLNDSEKTLIRHSNYKLLTPVAQDDSDYIEKLVQRSKFNFDQSLYTKDHIISEIRRAFIDVNQTTPEILEICSKSEDLVVIFDFDYTIIDEFEPGSTAVGLAQRQYDYVVIAANEFLSLDNNERNYALGTLSHELMHYAMYLVYDNDAAPYLKDDKETKNLFRNFTEKCKKYEKTEPHLAYPDESKPDEFHIELIARVPDILLMRQNQQLLLEIIKMKFPELFDFYYGKILQDMRAVTATMSDREKVREVNQWLDLVREIEEFTVEIIVKDVDSDCKKVDVKVGKDNEEEIDTDEADEDNIDEVNIDDQEGSGDDNSVIEVSTEKSDDTELDNEVDIEDNEETSTNIADQTQENDQIDSETTTNVSSLNSQEADDYFEFEFEDNKSFTENNETDIQNLGAAYGQNLNDKSTSNIQTIPTTKTQSTTVNSILNSGLTSSQGAGHESTSTSRTTTTKEPKSSTLNPNTIPVYHSYSIEDDDNQDNNIPAYIETTTTHKTSFPTDDEDYLASNELDDSQQLKIDENSNYDDDYEDENNSNYFRKRKPVDKGRGVSKLRIKGYEGDLIRSLRRSDQLVKGQLNSNGQSLLKNPSKLSITSGKLSKANLGVTKEKIRSRVTSNANNHPKKLHKVIRNNNPVKPTRSATNLIKIHQKFHQKLYKRSTNSSEPKDNPQNPQPPQNSSTSFQQPNLDDFIDKLGFEFSSNHSHHIVFTNFPAAILKFIHKKVTNSRQLAVFMKLSSGRLNNLHKFINDLSNLNSEVLIVIECDKIDYLSGIVDTLNGYSFKHVIFVADKDNFDDFESYEDKMEMREFLVLWDDVCPKSQDYLTKFIFYFQNDELKLSKIIGNNRSIMSEFDMAKIYNQDFYSIATDTVPESDEFYVERKLIDEDGRVWGLNRVVSDLFELEEEESEDRKEDDRENDEEEEEERPQKRGNIHGLSKKLESKIIEENQNSQRNFIKSTQKFQKYHKKSLVAFESILSSKSKKKSPKSKILTTNSSKIFSKTNQNSSVPQNIHSIFKHLRNSTTFILTGQPGSGKSTTFKEMVLKIREISPTLWVAYVNLTESELSSNFSDGILTALSEDVLKLTELDPGVFKHFYYQQRVVLLFDEFDKIDENSKKNLVNIFKFCEQNSVTIWVSTRPSNLKLLQHNLKVPKTFNLSDFSKSDTEKFLEYFDENREAEILEFLEQIGKVGNPRMIHEIAEIFDSHENITNWYSIYSQLVQNRNFQRSVKVLETFDIEEALSSPQKLLKAHQFAALNYLYSHAIIESLNLTKESPKILENYEIIYKNSKNETKFIHESFAAYFIAQYFAENLLKIKAENNKFENNLKVLKETTQFKSWRFVRRFLNDFIEVNKNKLDITLHSKVKKFLTQNIKKEENKNS